MTYQLRLFRNDYDEGASCRVAIISPGKTAADVKGAADNGYSLVLLVDLGREELPPVSCDELLLAPSEDAHAVDVLGLVAKLPRANDPDLHRHHEQEMREEMGEWLNEAYLDRIPQENTREDSED